MDKDFKIKPEDIKNIAIGYGACIATDMITVHGFKVGYMYRDEPESPNSGWIFMSGTETQDYLDNAENLELYDINTIANYDPDIVQFIEFPVGTECERDLRGDLKIVS